MTQIATVTAIPGPGTAEVTVARQTACGHSCDGCGRCAGRTPDLVIQAESGVPVALGDRLGTLHVSSGGEVVSEIPLLAGEEVPRVTYGQMLTRMLKLACLAG